MKFIHFGCWNEINSDHPPVLDVLKMLQLEKDYDFISMAGDNYYPSKVKIDGKKQKIFNKDNLNIGWEELPKDKEIIVIHGNHEIEDEYNNVEKCSALVSMLERESELVNFYNDKILFKKINKSLIIFFDSTIYTLPSETLLRETCYSNLKLGIDKETVGDLERFQNEEIIKIISENTDCENIFFICHTPIFSLKYKPEKEKNKVEFNERLTLFYLSIQEMIIDKKLYHLCADTHYFQDAEIIINKSLVFRQLIVGTGGAHLDDIPIGEVLEFDFEGTIIEISKINYQIKDYGYSIIEINDDNEINFNFVSLSSMKNKYLKYKKKYLNLKKMKNL